MNGKSGFAIASLVVSCVLVVVKVVASLLSGSISMLAEAINNSLDVVTSAVTLASVKISERPADREHPYGHGKVESLSALVTVGALFVIYLTVIRSAIERLIVPQPIESGSLSLAVILFGIVVNLVRVHFLTRAARQYRSQALSAEALNFRTDIMSSSVVLIAVFLTVLDPASPVLVRADAVGALVVSVMALFFGVRLGKQAIDTLLDRTSIDLTRRIREAARSVQGVSEVGAVRAREVGSQAFVDLSVSVPRSFSLESSHDLATEVENRVREIRPDADVVVHVEPMAPADEPLVESIRTTALRAGNAVHNVCVHHVGDRRYVQLDLEVNSNLTLQQAHDIATQLEQTIKREFNCWRVSVHIEPMNEPMVAQRIQEKEAAVREIERIARDHVAIQQVHNVSINRCGGRINLMMDCQIDPATSLSDAHLVAEQFERNLRRQIPNLGDVLIHTEPGVTSA
ncbi:MAG: cation-efflux pump [Anaerolineae bacterium]|nr:cation-efflux pump [Thermoflexales bacterium]MDW8408279.1 cation-efflux pump [Anaerolineae bacterium]